jgi:hypothetical protein
LTISRSGVFDDLYPLCIFVPGVGLRQFSTIEF